MPTRAYVRPGLVYMAGSERRNNVVVMFMGRQRRITPQGRKQNMGVVDAAASPVSVSKPADLG